MYDATIHSLAKQLQTATTHSECVRILRQIEARLAVLSITASKEVPRG